MSKNSPLSLIKMVGNNCRVTLTKIIVLKQSNLFPSQGFIYSPKIYYKMLKSCFEVPMNLSHLDFLFQKRFTSKLEVHILI